MPHRGALLLAAATSGKHDRRSRSGSSEAWCRCQVAAAREASAVHDEDSDKRKNGGGAHHIDSPRAAERSSSVILSPRRLRRAHAWRASKPGWLDLSGNVGPVNRWDPPPSGLERWVARHHALLVAGAIVVIALSIGSCLYLVATDGFDWSDMTTSLAPVPGFALVLLGAHNG